ncbi:kelch repeat-containing protein [Cytophaga aurantiaca]|uniref:kelch repeat-containing protein n=1 Tax=Cytophaga aurantiaca TaxID=29530 RepID=UPI00037C9B72|nr:kelch repeat-containing protein [Cytophaga aurantiaca]
MKTFSFRNQLCFLFFFVYTLTSSGQTVSVTGSLNSGRQYHCSEILSNGNVLIFGGHNDVAANNIIYSSSEIYNPSTQTWAYSGNMNVPRLNCTSVLLNNGNVLVMGGWNYHDGFSSCEIYDAATGTWKFAGSMHQERFLHASIKLRDGRVLVVGGGDSKVELYDPETDTWRNTGETKVTHGFYMAMTLMDDGKVLAIGGDDAPTSAEIYDPATEQWTLLTATTKFDRSSHTITRLNNGKFLIVGTGGVTTEEELSSEIYDPIANTFTQTGNLLNNVVEARTIRLDNGNVLLYNAGDYFNPLDSKCIQIYNASSGIWESKVYNFLGAFNATINMLNNGKVLLTGGSLTLGSGASSKCLLVSQDAFAGCTAPNISLEVKGNPGCNGSAASVTMPVTENMVSYEAYIGNQPSGNIYVGNGTALSLTIPTTVLSTGIHVIKVKAVKAGCAAYYLTDTAIVNIRIPAIATPVIVANGPTTMCTLTRGTVQLSAPAGMAAYEWSNGLTTQTITMSADGIVKVRVKDSPTGCFTRYSEPVKVAYVLPILNAGPDEGVCNSKAPYMLSGFSPAGGVWTGTGVRADGMFDPSLVGSGNVVLTYTFCNFTDTKNVYVIPTPKVPDFTLKADKDTVCFTQVTFLNVVNPVLYPATGTSYEFSSNNVLLYTAQYYSYSNTAYRTPYSDRNKTYTVKGVQKNSCGADSVTKTYTIYPAVDLSLSVGTKTPLICRNETALIYVVNSQKSVSYQLLSGSNFVGNLIKGNGDTLFLSTGSLKTSGRYAVVGTTSSCGGTLIQTVDITVPGPKANFTVESYNVETGNPINILLNPSNPAGTLYNWTFGTGSEKTSSNAKNPLPVTYNTTGSRIFKLTVTDKDNCVDSVSKQVHVIAPVNAADCSYSVSAGSEAAPSKPAAVTTDNDDNIFQVFETLTNGMYNYSQRGDSIYSQYEDIEKCNYIQPLNKYNAKGTLQWSTTIRHNQYDGIRSNNLLTDAAGNVYYAFFIRTKDSIRAYSTDGTYISFMPNYGVYNISSVVIIKYNKNGIVQWQNSYYESVQSQIALTLNKQSELYVTSASELYKFNAAGSFTWKKDIGYADIKADSEDNIVGIHSDAFVLEKFDGQGNILYSRAWDYADNINAQYIELDEQNNVYITGQFNIRMDFKNEALINAYYNATYTTNDYFFCKINAHNQDEWIKRINISGTPFLKGMDYKNGQLIFVGQTDPNEAKLRYNYKGIDSSYKDMFSGFYKEIFADSIIITNSGNFICLTDTSADGVVKMEKAQDNASWPTEYYSGFGGMNYNLICLNKNNKIIYADGNAASPIFGQSIVKQSALPESTVPNSSVLYVSSINCLLPAKAPVSAFTIPWSACANKNVTFFDISGDYPDSWLWTFEGGTPATSTLRNPVVTFNVAGTYNISLTASNATGSGSTFSKQIAIDPTLDLNIYSDTVCAGGTILVHATGAASYQWPAYTGTYRGDVYSFDQVIKGNQFDVKGFSESGGCYITKKYSIPVNPIPDVSISKKHINVCKTGITDLPAATPPGGIYYGAGVVNNKFDGSYVSYGFEYGYDFLIQYKYTDEHGCINYDYMSATLVQAPPVYFYSDINTICKGQSLNRPLATPLGGSFSGDGTSNGAFNYVALDAGQYSITYTYESNGCVAKSYTIITVQECVTTDVDAAAESAANFYPNPCTGFFNITNTKVSSGMCKIILYNVAGQRVQESTVQAQSTMRIDVSALPPGLYHFVLQSEDQTVIENNIIVR